MRCSREDRNVINKGIGIWLTLIKVTGRFRYSCMDLCIHLLLMCDWKPHHTSFPFRNVNPKDNATSLSKSSKTTTNNHRQDSSGSIQLFPLSSWQWPLGLRCTEYSTSSKCTILLYGFNGCALGWLRMYRVFVWLVQLLHSMLLQPGSVMVLVAAIL